MVLKIEKDMILDKNKNAYSGDNGSNGDVVTINLVSGA